MSEDNSKKKLTVEISIFMIKKIELLSILMYYIYLLELKFIKI